MLSFLSVLDFSSLKFLFCNTVNVIQVQDQLIHFLLIQLCHHRFSKVTHFPLYCAGLLFALRRQFHVCIASVIFVDGTFHVSFFFQSPQRS